MAEWPRLREELAIAELELHDARIDQTNVEGILAFVEHLLTNIGSVWLEASLQPRQQIQKSIFPEGHAVASPSIPSWNQILRWLREMQALRESVGDAA